MYKKYKGLWILFGFGLLLAMACNLPIAATPTPVTETAEVETEPSATVVPSSTPTETPSGEVAATEPPPSPTVTATATEVPTEEPQVIVVTVEVIVTATATQTPTAEPTPQVDLSACTVPGIFHRNPMFRSVEELASYPPPPEDFEREGNFFTVDIRSNTVLTTTVEAFTLTNVDTGVEVHPQYVEVLPELQDGCMTYVLWVDDSVSGRFYLTYEDVEIVVMPGEEHWYDEDSRVVNFDR